jgi:hypothetical protein
VVGHQRQVLVVFAPGDLIDADVDQPGEPVGIQHVDGDPLTDPAHCAPGDAGETADGGFVGLGGHSSFAV